MAVDEGLKQVEDSGRRVPPEWPSTLDIEEITAVGWQPTPFRQFVLKIHSRCNLACDYCYVYTLADQTWRSRPMVMPQTVLDATASRIAEHVQAHGLDRVRVIFHGGEPLLAGRGYLTRAATLIRDAAGSGVHVELGMQSNGILLDESWLRVLHQLHVGIGISLDGDSVGHDRRRRYANGDGSHADVVRALDLLSRPCYRDLYAGLLCTIDLVSDPVDTYEALLEHVPPAMDFLLPHGTWSSPPPGRTPDPDDAPYGDWLVAVFERWYGAPARETRIRLFEDIIHLLLGGVSTTEAVGLTPTSVVVVETDGSIEQTDALKSAYHGAPETGLHVLRDSFDMALRTPEIAARQMGVDALADTCRRCPVSLVCGGGLYPHRYRKGTGFRNPSVYCPDLFHLITHIRNRVIDDLRDLPRTSG